MSDREMKLLILSSSTGGGHEMRANALKSWWEEEGGKARIIRPLEDGFIFYRWGSNFYNLIQKKLPLFHYAYFHFLEHASLHRGSRRIFSPHSFTKEVKDFSPDIILSVHAHLNHGYFQLARQSLAGKRVKFIIFCGELADGHGFSRHWVNPAVDLFSGPFEETCEAAIKRGMPVDKTLVTGPLLRKAFYQRADEGEKQIFLQRYGLSSEVRTYVLGTGANGVNRHRQVIEAFNRSDDQCQLLALCGKNESTLADLKGIKGGHVPFVALPELGADEMAEVLRNADCLFARPGAGMTTEAIACGTPMIFDLSRGVMPQETNNLNFWRSRSSSIVSTARPRRLPKLVTKEIPVVNLEMDRSPRKLLDTLSQLAGE